MGEGNEQTPFAIITHAPHIEFQSTPLTREEIKQISIPLEEDFYAPLRRLYEHTNMD
jgi:F420-0:gamma-glutamyl ligase